MQTTSGGRRVKSIRVALPESDELVVSLNRHMAEMLSSLKAGREAGRRDAMVIVAEGAKGRDGEPAGGSPGAGDGG